MILITPMRILAIIFILAAAGFTNDKKLKNRLIGALLSDIGMMIIFIEFNLIPLVVVAVILAITIGAIIRIL